MDDLYAILLKICGASAVRQSETRTSEMTPTVRFVRRPRERITRRITERSAVLAIGIV
jgi:hypothetical protein